MTQLALFLRRALTGYVLHGDGIFPKNAKLPDRFMPMLPALHSPLRGAAACDAGAEEF
jgi:hypothetical protein